MFDVSFWNASDLLHCHQTHHLIDIERVEQIEHLSERMLWVILLQLTMLIAGFSHSIRPCSCAWTGYGHVLALQQQSRRLFLRSIMQGPPPPGTATTTMRKFYSSTRLQSSSLSIAAATISANQTNVGTESPAEIMERRRLTKERRKASKTKRKALLGVAKAVDRGRGVQVTYAPGGVDGLSFRAKSGLPDRTRPFTVLGIESSCDDTGAAVVRSDGVILGQALASQQEIHEAWGGVVPGLARDAHVAKIHDVVQEALQNANLTSPSQVDAIAVTVGPGLEICLRVGCDKARDLAMQYRKPFVAIHHLEAHILMARLPSLIAKNDAFHLVPATADKHESRRAVGFPFLALLVSGGHCQIMKCLGIGRYEQNYDLRFPLQGPVQFQPLTHFFQSHTKTLLGMKFWAAPWMIL
jgi:tRNA N6-adenosine threonylcarbamoyltransferase